MSDDNDRTDHELLRERRTRDLNNPLLPLWGRYEYRQGWRRGFVWGILTVLVLYAVIWGALWLIDNGAWLLSEYKKYV